jgi:hypothetical protein
MYEVDKIESQKLETSFAPEVCKFELFIVLLVFVTLAPDWRESRLIGERPELIMVGYWKLAR